MKKILILLLCWAAPVLANLQPLPVDDAFTLSAINTTEGLQLKWQIAPGYQLYRDRTQLTLVSHATLPSYTLPEGMTVNEVTGPEQVYREQAYITLPVSTMQPGEYRLAIQYQGCSLQGFCYPPQTKILLFQTSQFGTHVVEWLEPSNSITSSTTNSDTPSPKSNIALLLLSFFGLGILLAFTPCVLPLIPILSSIILGKKRTTREAFYLSLTYVLAMAISYAGAGLLAGLAGSYLQAFLQKPFIIILFAGLFLLLALSLFGVYDLKLPAQWQAKIDTLSSRQKRGNYVGVAIMGALSILIVSPCVSAPLVAALVYISQSGQQAFGGIMLFLMGLGMGLPLLIIGTLGNRFLPKAGEWMNAIKFILGLLLVIVAINLLGRLIPGFILLILYSIVAVITAIYFFIRAKCITRKLIKAIMFIIAGLLLIYSVLLIIGGIQKHDNPWKPLMAHQQSLSFNSIIHNNTEFNAALQSANNKPIMLDVYADWCVSCKKIESTIFTNEAVQDSLKNYYLIRFDVTANDSGNRELEKKLDVFAPPTIIFFNTKHQETARLFGEFTQSYFLSAVKK